MMYWESHKQVVTPVSHDCDAAVRAEIAQLDGSGPGAVLIGVDEVGGVEHLFHAQLTHRVSYSTLCFSLHSSLTHPVSTLVSTTVLHVRVWCVYVCMCVRPSVCIIVCTTRASLLR